MLVTLKEIAVKWGLSDRRVAQLCAAGEIPGAVKEGRFWKIPEDAQIPEIVKKKEHYIDISMPRTTVLLPFDRFRDHMRNTCPDCKKREFCMGGCPLKPEIVLCEDHKSNEKS